MSEIKTVLVGFCAVKPDALGINNTAAIIIGGIICCLVILMGYFFVKKVGHF